MLCPNCKNEIPDDSKFCPDCGTKIDNRNATPLKLEELFPINGVCLGDSVSKAIMMGYSNPDELRVLNHISLGGSFIINKSGVIESFVFGLFNERSSNYWPSKWSTLGLTRNMDYQSMLDFFKMKNCIIQKESEVTFNENDGGYEKVFKAFAPTFRIHCTFTSSQYEDFSNTNRFYCILIDMC